MKTILTSILLTLCALTTSAQTLEPSTAQITAHTTWAINLPTPLVGSTALQLDVVCPDGLSITAITTDEAHSTYNHKQTDGALRIIVVSDSNTPFADNMLTLTLTAESPLPDGNYDVQLTGISIALPDGTENKLPNATATLISNGEETSIAAATAKTNGQAATYDLSGRRTNKNLKGLQIRGARKVLLK